MNIRVDFDNIVVKEDKNDFNVKVLMLKGEKGEPGAASWGAITGTLSNQTDLKNALDGKANQTDFNTLSNQVSTNTSNIDTINGQITDINGELDDYEDLFYGNATVNDEDTSITLDNTVKSKFQEFNLKGNTSQSGTPTPSSPIPVNVVSGDNDIVVCGKNLCPNSADTQTLNSGGTLTKNNDGTYTLSGGKSNVADLLIIGTINVRQGETYYLSNDFASNNNNLSIRRGSTSLVGTTSQSKVGYTATANETLNVYIRYQDTSTLIYKPMISKNVNDNFEPYQGNTYNIDLPSGMELCKIGNYQDYFYKDSGKWYKYGMIGKKVLDGTEAWQVHGGIASWFYVDNLIYSVSANSRNDFLLSNYFVQNSYNYATTITNGEMVYSYQVGGGPARLVLKDTDYTTVADFKTWLSTHNTNLYYQLATPTSTEITYQPLIEQLDNIYNAISYDNQTNISQVNNELPFIIYAEAFANTFNGRIAGLDYKIENCEQLSNKVTSINSSSTDNEYPSAKAVYDLFNSITDGDEVSY